MQKPITPDIVVAYRHCPRKAFLLLYAEEAGKPNPYAEMLTRRQRLNETAYVNNFKQAHSEAVPYDAQDAHPGQRPLLQPTLRVQDLEAHCAVLTTMKHGQTAHNHGHEPTIAAGTHTISQEQRLELQFVGYVLGQVQHKLPPAGTIIGLGEQAKRVSLATGYAALLPIIRTLRDWLLERPPEPPPVILNKHCPQCPFQATCTAKAEHEDELSLLDRMTPKTRRRYHDRGIFTVRQLSYLFKPRRQRKRAQQAPVRYQLELHALALRTGKTYLHDLPALQRYSTELFLDIEGVPDQHFYYLIGLLVCHEGHTSYNAFWANTPDDEAQIWQALLTMLDEYREAPIYHYGSYEPRAIATLEKRYNSACDRVKQRLVNINAAVYGKVYFPVRSNRLKDIGHFLHAAWTSSEASGLQSLVWRQDWEDTRDETYKDTLLTYNQEDCTALQVVTDELTRLRNVAASEAMVDFAAQAKRQATNIGEQLHHQFETLLKSAHAGYEKMKISLRARRGAERDEPKRSGGQKGHPGYTRIIPKARSVVHLPQRIDCPVCENQHLRPSNTRPAEKTIIDLVFSKAGCRKTITRYVGAYGSCGNCGHRYLPVAISGPGNRVFGRGFQVWIIYQRLVLRLPYLLIVQVIADQFGEGISQGSITHYISNFAKYYTNTEDMVKQRILDSPVIHADETKINIRGIDQYVWVFTDGHHVIFKLTKTRESTIVHEMLGGYRGILVSDFYPGYDSVDCRQQKCLAHLIRDLNDDLWSSPFDSEFENFVLQVKNLLVPMLEAADKYGLKQRHLHKFLQNVERFYKSVINEKVYRSPLVVVYQKRFKRYRNSLFTFLEEDGVPWNNNMAERAIRHLAVQRKISGSFFETGAQQYLVLLGIAQTCRFQEKSLLQFLLSGEKDIDAFKSIKRRATSIAVGASTSKGNSDDASAR